jgi:hypothetical protein
MLTCPHSGEDRLTRRNLSCLHRFQCELVWELRFHMTRVPLPRFGMKPRPIPEMVNSAQTSESHEIKKVTAPKEV